MKKQVKIGFVIIGLLLCTVLPFGATVKAQPEPMVSEDFEACMENIYKNKQPMIRSWCVWRIQNFLNEMKWMRAADGKSVRRWPTLELDRLYGPETAKAVEAYQRATRSDGVPGNAGTIDGIVGPDTWESIRTDCVDRWGHQHNFHSQTCFVVE